ncbi:MAG TPA: hypothetical protein VNK49_03125 [Anaerolineales bacterium]|nr:hypothetical protein [Anaerolineales bacterium]
MADIRCPNCGKNNPDFLDACQFCGTSLESESSLRIGESPKKIRTSELEPILPQWLKEVRQQNRETTEEEAAEAATQPQVRKDEAPDLLSGLFQAETSEEEEIPDWLSAISPLRESSPVSKKESPADFFAQFEKASEPAPEETAEREDSSGMEETQEPVQEDWFSQILPQSETLFQEAPGEEAKFGAAVAPFEAEPPTSSEAEDLSWLRELEAFAKQVEQPVTEASVAEPSAPQEDLDWLKNLAEASGVQQETSATPPSAEEDLSWLDKLGSVPEPPVESATESSPPVSPFTRRTGPLAGIEDNVMPDWLKSALEETSKPSPSAPSLDWLNLQEETKSQEDVQVSRPVDESLDLSQGEPASAKLEAFSAESKTPPFTGPDVDSLFNIELPDWLSQTGESVAETPESTQTAEVLTPVELPSWVQAMRPVETVLESSLAAEAEQIVEKEGPLAGFRNVIPLAPIGSSRRPKPISLKLQATEEQQAGAALLERLIAGETVPQAIKAVPFLTSQRMLRLALTAIFLLVLGAVLGVGSRLLPVSALFPVHLTGISNVVASIPENSPVLVVIDYEPSLAGEMEAAAGPLLDQMALARHPIFTFLSTSPNGTALAERLMRNIGINKPIPDGLGYQLGTNYFNIGYLPGGSAGVLGFLEDVRGVMPWAQVADFSNFAAVVLLTDHPESGRVWVEQLEWLKQNRPSLANQPLLVVASAQAGPLMQPYVSAGQVEGMISGISDAARYEFVNSSRPGIVRAYWDAFGAGLMMAIVLITMGGFWNLIAGFRARGAEEEQG